MKLWPRLPNTAARDLFEVVSTEELTTLRETATISHPDAAALAVGGSPVDDATIRKLQEAVRDIADDLGFPEPLQPVTIFDQRATRVLHETMGIVPADAASAEVWAFVTLVVLPDVAAWRFTSRVESRLLGNYRNVFRRLWWRAETIGVDLIDVPDGLGEDELVNIMERANLAANPRNATMLARLVVEHGTRVGVARSELMRDLSKRFLREQVVVNIDVLEDRQVQDILERHFEESVSALGVAIPG
ncbi:MAG: hypothetical protein ACLFRV_06030 [Acidimicrobiales bacterium]